MTSKQLNEFYDLIKEAEASELYSKHEIQFFLDIWDATRLKRLEDKYKNGKDPSN